MVDIISKRDGPRREDIAARRHLGNNWGTIEKLADQISGGAYSASRKPQAAQQAPAAATRTVHAVSSARVSAEPRPYIRISANDRVVVVDYETGRQMHFLGEIRRINGAPQFVLATSANHFFAPLEEDVAVHIADLDGVRLGEGLDEEQLARAIGERLDIE